MWPFRIWSTSSPSLSTPSDHPPRCSTLWSESASASPRACPPLRPLTPGHTLGRRLTTLLLALVFLSLSSWLPLASRADAAIEILDTTIDYTYSESLDFAIQARADLPIVEAILFYGVVDSGVVRRIYPAAQAGLQVDIQHSEVLEGGQFAPGVRMEAWWELIAQDGSLLRTERQRFTYTDTAQSWQQMAGERVDLYWYGRTREQSRAQEVLDTAETTVARLEGEIGVSVDRRVQVYVYNNQSDMRPSLSSRSAIYDDLVMTLGVAVAEDTLLLLGSASDLDQVTAHELSHIVVGLATDNPYLGLPRWLDEGLAMYAEGEFPADNRRALEDAVARDALISIRSLSSYSGQAEQVDLYYGEVRSVVDYMLSAYGKAKLDELLQVFAQGARAEDALQRVYGFGLDELDDGWRASLGLAPRPTRSSPAAEGAGIRPPRARLTS